MITPRFFTNSYYTKNEKWQVEYFGFVNERVGKIEQRIKLLS